MKCILFILKSVRKLLSTFWHMLGLYRVRQGSVLQDVWSYSNSSHCVRPKGWEWYHGFDIRDLNECIIAVYFHYLYDQWDQKGNSHIHILAKFNLEEDCAAWSRMSKRKKFFSEIIGSLFIWVSTKPKHWNWRKLNICTVWQKVLH